MEMTREEWLKEFRKELLEADWNNRQIEEEVNSTRTQELIGTAVTPQEWAELVTM